MFGLMATRRAGLRVRYGEAHRCYHGQAHVDALLRGLHDLRGGWRTRTCWSWRSGTTTQCMIRRHAALLRTEMMGLVDAACRSAAVLMVERTADHLLPAGLPDGRVIDRVFPRPRPGDPRRAARRI